MTDPTSNPAVTIDVEAALARMRSGRVNRAEDDRMAAAVDTAVERTLREAEARGAVVTGLSGAGKTTGLARVIRKHPHLGVARDADCRIISVSTPGACTFKELGRRICWAAGYPIQTASEAGVIWDKARQACRAGNVRFLHLDEFQNVTGTARSGEDTKIRDTLKSLLIDPEWKLGLILSGQPQVVGFLEADQQVSRRLAFVQIGRMKQDDLRILREVILRFAGELGLRLDPGLATWLVPRMAHAALGQFGTAVENLLQALERALSTDAFGTLTSEHFAGEFAARTGNAAFANPFLTSDWETLDCGRRNITDPDQLVHARSAPPARKRREKTR